MGRHRKETGLDVIQFIVELGGILGHFVKEEEYMFPGSPTSPILDVTWRRYQYEKYPLFIFEVESLPSKSAVDNALKVFSRTTERFPKPLFFFHLFMEKPTDTDRIDSLRNAYDKINYSTYVFSNEVDQARFIEDILDQHFRVESTVNLYEFVRLLEERNPSRVTSQQVLARLIQLGYDRFDHAHFLSTLEELIVDKGYKSVQAFYSSYLPIYLSYRQRLPQSYPRFYTPMGYSPIIHFALSLLTGTQVDENEVFEHLQELERHWKPWPLWGPFFGLSQDHDLIMLSEFPLLLTMLSLGFQSTPYAAYFSGKLKAILAKSGVYNHFTAHGFVWLLIASIIADDLDSYEFAREIINQNGGIPLDLLIEPTVIVSEEVNEGLVTLEEPQEVPSFQDWKSKISGFLSVMQDVDVLGSVIEGFLLMKNWESARTRFAAFCLQRSVET